MTIYCVGIAKLNDVEKLKQYKEHAASALSKHEGAVVSASPNPTALDGDGAGIDLIVILSFPTKQHVIDWREDKTLVDVHALRNASGDWQLHILE